MLWCTAARMCWRPAAARGGASRRFLRIYKAVVTAEPVECWPLLFPSRRPSQRRPARAEAARGSRSTHCGNQVTATNTELAYKGAQAKNAEEPHVCVKFMTALLELLSLLCLLLSVVLLLLLLLLLLSVASSVACCCRCLLLLLPSPSLLRLLLLPLLEERARQEGGASERSGRSERSERSKRSQRAREAPRE